MRNRALELDHRARIAELYAERTRRLARKDVARALDAFRASERWMEAHVGYDAWSYEAMLHRERLVRDLGFDPAAPSA